MLFSGQQKEQNQELLNSINALNDSIQKLIEFQPQPWVFLTSQGETLSSNVNENVLIIPGVPVPVGFKGVLEDYTVSFSTVNGTVKFAILDRNNNRINDLLNDINSNDSGSGGATLEEGQKVAVLGQSAGAGQFGVRYSGKLVKVRI